MATADTQQMDIDDAEPNGSKALSADSDAKTESKAIPKEQDASNPSSEYNPSHSSSAIDSAPTEPVDDVLLDMVTWLE